MEASINYRDLMEGRSPGLFARGPPRSSIGSVPVLGRTATDNRDYIYGILGLIYPEQARQIPPDYTMSTAEVFATATAVSFMGEYASVIENLHMLRNVDFRGPHMQDLPSWAVDFETAATRRLHHDHDDQRPSLAKRPRLSGFFSYPVLKLRGCQFDIITFCIALTKRTMLLRESTEWTFATGRDELQPTIDEAVVTARGSFTSPNPSRLATSALHTLLDATLCPSRQNCIDYNGYAQFAPIIDVLIQWQNAASVKRAYQLRPGQLYEELVTYEHYATICANGWVLFATESGLLGVGPASIAERDILIMPEYSWRFLVVRPTDTGSAFRFRGIPCVFPLTKAGALYEAKVWVDWKPEEGQWRDFELC